MIWARQSVNPNVLRGNRRQRTLYSPQKRCGLPIDPSAPDTPPLPNRPLHPSPQTLDLRPVVPRHRAGVDLPQVLLQIVEREFAAPPGP